MIDERHVNDEDWVRFEKAREIIFSLQHKTRALNGKLKAFFGANT
jgi:hypothetical protein